MFDPSKLDLDLNENLDNNSKKEIEKESNKTEKEIELKTENIDILGNLNDSISDKLENNSVIKEFEKSSLNQNKEEMKKSTENKNENSENEKNKEI